MLFSTNREDLRREFYSAWNKKNNQQVLTLMDEQILAVIELHPEYHFIFQNSEKYLTKDYFPELGETNPFLHMSMHLAVQDQAKTNRPKGYQSIYQRVIRNLSSMHDAEHLLMEVLAEGIHKSQQQSKQMPDSDYLKLLKKHLKRQGIKH